MTIKLSVALTEQQHDGIQAFAQLHGITGQQLIRDVVCDLAGLDASIIRPRKSKHPYDPVRMPPPPDQDMEAAAADLARRGFAASYMAARTKLKWAEIDKIMKANPRHKPDGDV